MEAKEQEAAPESQIEDTAGSEEIRQPGQIDNSGDPG